MASDKIEKVYKHVKNEISSFFGNDIHLDFNKAQIDFAKHLKNKNIKAPEKEIKEILMQLSEEDDQAFPVFKKLSDYKKHLQLTINNSQLKIDNSHLTINNSKKDKENIPLKEDIDTFFEKEVIPFVPNAWYNARETKIGYEINFAKYFYKYQAPRSLEEITADILKIEEQTQGLLNKIINH